MPKINPDELCTCGSSKKYKDCYLIDSDECVIFIAEKKSLLSSYGKSVEEILEVLTLAVTETDDLFVKTTDDKISGESWYFIASAINGDCAISPPSALCGGFVRKDRRCGKKR